MVDRMVKVADEAYLVGSLIPFDHPPARNIA
jgi:hypothetical protein